MEASERKENRSPANRRRGTRQLLRRESRYLQKCNQKVDAATSEEEKDKCKDRAEQCRDRRAAMYSTQSGSRPAPPKPMKLQYQCIDQQKPSATAENAVPMLIDNGLCNEDIIEVLENAEDEDDDVTVDGPSSQLEVQEEEREVSARRIRVLKRTAKTHIINGTELNKLKTSIKESYKGSDASSKREVDTVNKLCSVLRPYIRPEDVQPSTIAHLPLVLISNIVQQVAVGLRMGRAGTSWAGPR